MGARNRRDKPPQSRSDDRLSELEMRLGAVPRSRERLRALLEAVASIEGELDFDAVLRRIVEAAAGLVEARYGALAVIEPGGRLSRLVTVGLSREQAEEIERRPAGHGLISALIKTPRLLRLSDLRTHPESSGFPLGHPRLRRLLAVPVRVRGEVFGNLYLAEKERGVEFDEDDVTAVTALVAAAGVAVENARLYQEARRRERWRRASAEVSTSLLSGTDPGDVLALITRRARQICDASFALVALVRDEHLVVEAADGAHADVLRGFRVPIDEAVAGAVFRSGVALVLDGTERDERRLFLPEGVHAGPALIVPMGSGPHARGALSVLNPPEGAIFGQMTRRLLETFAGQAVVALELAERRRDTERLVVLEDRDRIAKDLHDTVIQRLFATAMNLMSVVKITESPEVSVRVQRAVDDLDETIRQIRSTIFALQTAPDARGLRARIHAVVGSAVEGLGFAPEVRVDGLVDTTVPEHVGEHLLAVLSEALSNAVRHARADRVSVSVDVADEVVLRVADDGVGIDPGGRRSGLRNMADRAAALGGSFQIHSGHPAVGHGWEAGTVVEWRVPVVPRAD